MTGWPKGRPPAHAYRPWPAPEKLVGYAAGVLAALAIAVAGATWLESEGPARSTPTSANRITVTPGADTSVSTR